VNVGDFVYATEDFRNKKILILAPDDISTVIDCARYLPIMSTLASDVFLKIHDTHGFAGLIESSIPDVSVLLPNNLPFAYDLVLDLIDLPQIFANENILVPVYYLHPPLNNISKFRSIMNSSYFTNIGLALYGCSSYEQVDYKTISDNITMDQRHNTQFFFIPSDPANIKAKPPYSHFINVTVLVDNYCELASLLASLDIITALIMMWHTLHLQWERLSGCW
jgi:hypothetical protein